MTNTISVRFYVKYLDKDTPKTARLSSEQGLLDFVQFCIVQGFAIVDTHMAFYDVELVASDFHIAITTAPIDHMDINLAKDGEWVMQNYTQSS